VALAFLAGRVPGLVHEPAQRPLPRSERYYRGRKIEAVLATEHEAPSMSSSSSVAPGNQYGDEGLDYYLQPGNDDDSDHGFYVM
jgi:hypothetical protein